MTVAKKNNLPTRYKANPFYDDMVIPVAQKQVRIQQLGKQNNVIVDNSTGEELCTALTTFKRVDQEQFVKLFTQNIALTFDLNSAGIKAFNVLLYIVQNKAISKDTVYLGELEKEEFQEIHSIPKYSQSTFLRGLKQLVDSQIIAHHTRPGMYFINPNFCFNGDRISFTTILEKKTGKEIKKLNAKSMAAEKKALTDRDNELKSQDMFGVKSDDFE